MKTSHGKRRTDRGFTLIEIIATLVMVSIFGVALFRFFNSSITNSPAPIVRLKDEVDIGNQAEIHAVIYAPNADVTFENHAQLFGAVIGNDIELN